MDFKVEVVPGNTLPTQPFWQDLHQIIERAYKNQDLRAFPPSWHRLHPDPAIADPKLVKELGPNGSFVVFFDKSSSSVVAGTGVVPFRGEDWINHAKGAGAALAETSDGSIIELDGMPIRPSAINSLPKATVFSKDWEVCCFCVNPSHRGHGLSHLLLDTLIGFIVGKGAGRLFAGFSVEETGQYWSKMGSKIIPGAGGVFKKGLQT